MGFKSDVELCKGFLVKQTKDLNSLKTVYTTKDAKPDRIAKL